MLVSSIFFLAIVVPAIAAPVARIRDEARLVTEYKPRKGMVGKVPATAVSSKPQQEQEPNVAETPEVPYAPDNLPGHSPSFEAPAALPGHNHPPKAVDYPDVAKYPPKAVDYPDIANYPDAANKPEVESYPDPNNEVDPLPPRPRRALPLNRRWDPKVHADNVQKYNDRQAFHASRVDKFNYTWGHYRVVREKGQDILPGTPGSGGGHHVKSCPANKDYSKCVTH